MSSPQTHDELLLPGTYTIETPPSYTKPADLGENEVEAGAGEKVSSPHSQHHSSLHPPLTDDGQDTIGINDSNHYTHIVVIASEADAISRRQAIREKYFGLWNNLLPCMQFNTNTMYKFWIYGEPPKPDTPLRRQYEGEKIEWNDLEEQPKGTTFEQSAVLEWASNRLHQQSITYDYLIVQDINTFFHLETVMSELENRVITRMTGSPVAINSDAPTNVVWGRFSGDITDKHAFVIGAAAVEHALERQQVINAFDQSSSPHLLTNMYNYYQLAGNDETQGANLDPTGMTSATTPPQFIREDTLEDTRFIRWENNVESVHMEDVAVTMVLQDAEFTELALWTHLKPVKVCYTRKSAFKAGQPLSEALDDDEDATDIVDQETETGQVANLLDNGLSIALLTSSYIYDACMEPSAALSAANKRRFAERHGHTFVARGAEFAQQKGRRTVWGKVDAVEKVLPKYDWIFWMDMDAVILNPERSLDALLADLRARYPDGDAAFDTNVHLIAARPSRDPMVNAGVFFLRNSPWSMQFLRDLQGMTEWYNKRPSYEQGAMWDLMRLPANQEHVFLLDGDDHTFNTFPRFYKPGDFVVHFAPDRCPNDATLKGLDAAQRIENGETILSLDEE